MRYKHTRALLIYNSNKSKIICIQHENNHLRFIISVEYNCYLLISHKLLKLSYLCFQQLFHCDSMQNKLEEALKNLTVVQGLSIRCSISVAKL